MPDGSLTLAGHGRIPNKAPRYSQGIHGSSFTVLKTKKVFSTISIDHVHKQNNSHIKGGGGAVGLTDNPVPCSVGWLLDQKLLGP